jgi:hypothetical protein
MFHIRSTVVVALWNLTALVATFGAAIDHYEVYNADTGDVINDEL